MPLGIERGTLGARDIIFATFDCHRFLCHTVSVLQHLAKLFYYAGCTLSLREPETGREQECG